MFTLKKSSPIGLLRFSNDNIKDTDYYYYYYQCCYCSATVITEHDTDQTLMTEAGEQM